MKNKRNLISPLLIILFIFTIIFPGCEFIGDVFKAGIWVGIIIIIAILAVIGLIVKMFTK